MNLRTVWVVSVTVIASFSITSGSASGQIAPEAGWQATLGAYNGAGPFHNVSGTVTIVDADTIQIDDFTFDGGGLAVYFYLSPSESTLGVNNLEIGPDLLGTVYDGTQAAFTIDLPAGTTIDGYHAVSVWCKPAGASFGSGTFAAVPEPGAGGMFALGSLVLLAFRRRARPAR